MPKALTIRTGPWKGVYTTNDPFDADPEYLIGAKNTYIPDVMAGSGVYGRPGFRLAFAGEPLYVGADAFRGQCIYSHPMLDGTTISLLVHGGRIFRVDPALGTREDVTPTGVSIDASVTTRVYMCSCVGQLIVTDGVHRPWVGSDLTSTPIVGTYIDYDSQGVSWTAFGKPVVYLGAVFFILNEVNGVARRLDVAYSEPGLPATGYQQTDYDNNISLITASGSPLFALFATNTALYYWRAQSIGTIAGPDIGNLSSTPSEDAIAFNVGTQTSGAIAQFGSSFFFPDAIGRPWLFTYGTAPKPIWYDMRGVVQSQSVASPETTAIVSTACIEPTLNKYVAALWSPDPLALVPPDTMYVFDAVTGGYEAIWQVTDPDDPTAGLSLECIGVLTDSSGRSQFVAMTPGGYIYFATALTSDPSALTTEGGDTITTEGGDPLVTESLPATWDDNGTLPETFVETDRLGYDEDTNLFVDRVTVITLNPGPVQVTVNATMTPSSVEGAPEPSISHDGTYRLVCGVEAFGRGPSVQVRPLTAVDQFAIERISMSVVASRAGPEDA